jgi:hypothetical protein
MPAQQQQQHAPASHSQHHAVFRSADYPYLCTLSLHQPRSPNATGYPCSLAKLILNVQISVVEQYKAPCNEATDARPHCSALGDSFLLRPLLRVDSRTTTPALRVGLLYCFCGAVNQVRYANDSTQDPARQVGCN